jgi:hypothetical protein
MTSKTATTKASVVELYRMLAYMRPHYSKTEDAFIHEFLEPLGVTSDTFGNLYKRIGTAPVMWSSHTDTVHFKGGKQNIALRDKRIIELDNKSASSCLGADDTAGVWLMSEMIKAEVSGLYVFHRGEEVGCKGSEWLLKNNVKALDGIKACVALDRRDNDSVITFQRGNRCCSDDFGKSMAEELNSIMWGDQHLDYKLDNTGIYTDSATYTDVVGECTNLSVGYKGQHGKMEQLDLYHIAALREALIRIDLSKLRFSRVAGTKESKWQTYGGHNSYGWRHGVWEDDDFKEVDYLGSGTRKMYVDSFHHGYMKVGTFDWVQLTLPEWEAWRTKVLLKAPKTGVTSTVKPPERCKHNTLANLCHWCAVDRKKLAAAGQDAVSKAMAETVPKVDKPIVPKMPLAKDDMPDIVMMIQADPEAFARMLMDWGFDRGQLDDLVFEYTMKDPEKKETTTTPAPTKEGAPTIQ